MVGVRKKHTKTKKNKNSLFLPQYLIQHMCNFIHKTKSTLQEKIPYELVFKNEFLNFLKSSFALIVMLYVLGFFNPKNSVFYFFSGFFLTILIVFIFNYFLNSLLISKMISSEKWCLWKEILRRLFFLSVYCFAIILYIDYSLHIDFSKADFWQFVIASFIIGSIPIIIKIFIVKNKLLKHSLNEVYLLQTKRNLYQTKTEKEEIIIKSNIINEVFKIDVNDIIYLKSEQNYISIFYLKEGELKNHLLRISLVNALKQITSEDIFRCHRSYVININSIEKITGNAQSLKLQLSKNCVVPVSRSYMKEFKIRVS